MKNSLKITILLLLPGVYLILPPVVSAHCPLCVGGAVVGLSVARFLGVDDAITGLWMAAFLGAIAFWFGTFILRKYDAKISGQIRKFIKPAIYVVIFGLTIWSFYAFNNWAVLNLKFFLINTHLSKIMGLDRLTFGLVLGGAIFYLVDILDNFLIKRNGKVYFPYQRIFFSLGSILLASIILFILLNFA
ncbi:hypothetical protein MUP46_03900 [Patescibacteria group bacterium]|nr:hypothetical protein [Patescibacteria group bacterium]